MLLFLHFPPKEQAFIERAAEQLDVSGRCSFQAGLDHLFDLAEGKLTAANKGKFPAVIFLNGDAEGFSGSLKTLKSHEVLNRIPVVCLGYSKPQEEIVGLYKMGANSYIVKPDDFETMMKVSATALSYWLDTTLLPQEHLEDL